MRLLSAARLRVLTARAPRAGFHHADLRIDNVMEVDGVTGCACGAERAPSAAPPSVRARRAGAPLQGRGWPCRPGSCSRERAPRSPARRRLAGGGRRARARVGAGVLLISVCAERR